VFTAAEASKASSLPGRTGLEDEAGATAWLLTLGHLAPAMAWAARNDSGAQTAADD